MPHTSRAISESGFYHIVTKGDGSQVIFEDDHQRERYLAMMAQATQETGVEIHAYCLMSNHVHLLARDEKGAVSDFMKKLDERYAMYFSYAAGRIGHVFQGRFWSEPVETDERFLATLRYIHANPEPAGICRLADYPWSSYRLYLEGSPLIVTDMAFSLLGSSKSFVAFSASGGRYASPFPGSKLKRHLSQDELTHVAIELLGREALHGLKERCPEQRRRPLLLLEKAGFTTQDIARTTGLGYSSIQNVLKRAR